VVEYVKARNLRNFDRHGKRKTTRPSNATGICELWREEIDNYIVKKREGKKI
jgi:hypothetical protein